MMKKLTCMILGLAMAGMIVISCGKEENGAYEKPAPDDGSSAGQIPEESGESEKIEYMGYMFPEADYGGHEFKILNFEMQEWAYTAMCAEEQTGDAINDSIYMRNVVVEEKLGIKINDIRVAWGAMTAPLNNSVKAGTDDYDIALLNAYESGKMAQKGMFLNLNDIAALELGEPWWDQNANKSLEIAGKLYFTTTDSSAFTYDLMCTMFFNKQMLADLGLENPYELVLGNKWTMDKLLEMMRAAARDTDGDGVFTYEDIWGLATHAVQDIHFFAGGKMVLVDKDGDSRPVLRIPDERFVGAYAKVREIFTLANGYCISAGSNEGKTAGKTEELGSPEKFFMANKALFLGQCLSIAQMMRESETDFGIIPHPKYNESQDSYYSLMDGNFPTLTVPVTQNDPEMVGVVMNALTAVSSTTLKYAYYDISLNNKLIRDEDSLAMLDIELQNRVYDLAMIYGWGDMTAQFRQAAFSPTGENPMTVFEKYAEKTQTSIEKMLNDFDEIE